jgi:hypothetical protein
MSATEQFNGRSRIHNEWHKTLMRSVLEEATVLLARSFIPYPKGNCW